MNEPMILGKVLKVTFNPVQSQIYYPLVCWNKFVFSFGDKSNGKHREVWFNCLCTVNIVFFINVKEKKNPFLRLGFLKNNIHPDSVLILIF